MSAAVPGSSSDSGILAGAHRHCLWQSPAQESCTLAVSRGNGCGGRCNSAAVLVKERSTSHQLRRPDETLQSSPKGVAAVNSAPMDHQINLQVNHQINHQIKSSDQSSNQIMTSIINQVIESTIKSVIKSIIISNIQSALPPQDCHQSVHAVLAVLFLMHWQGLSCQQCKYQVASL